MRLPITRKDVTVMPDSKRVIARFFYNGEERAKEILAHLNQFDEQAVYNLIAPILQEFSKRHRNITRILEKNADKLMREIPAEAQSIKETSRFRKLLIGAYFTHEYSIESAAFFNPSIIEDPDQSDLVEGERRLIISFRAVGEGHISSIVFRRALLKKNNDIEVMPAGRYVDEAEIVKNNVYKRELFLEKAEDARISKKTIKLAQENLPEKFDYRELKNVVENLLGDRTDKAGTELQKLLWLADSYHEIIFSLDTDISDRIIYPITEYERKGIEDARFVRFTDDEGGIKYYATYTAYDGKTIMPKLLETTDFYDFKVRPVYGSGAKNKNLALFPRKINGKYVMMSRIDGWNNYIMYSDKINIWTDPIQLQSPKYPWEFVQIGNCGSPIETEHGWLVVTHGVGAMRRYCLGISLLDLNDPGREIGRLKEPLLIANTDEREGYVPNVVYSCGSIINNGELIIPYGLSDYSSSFMTVNLNDLMERLLGTDSHTVAESNAEQKKDVSRMKPIGLAKGGR
ncbi:glycoside hydrolase family 130 protein [Pedobacter arcticus]|uniref:glycoside hydrolase family 130 protein n=1 Tax=Pedobacter arcticus TaxID=752140 RepID=UPI00030CFF29|nr:glycoside hydrolase family 130 protein [Pedobacter arcticus]